MDWAMVPRLSSDRPVGKYCILNLSRHVAPALPGLESTQNSSSNRKKLFWKKLRFLYIINWHKSMQYTKNVVPLYPRADLPARVTSKNVFLNQIKLISKEHKISSSEHSELPLHSRKIENRHICFESWKDHWRYNIFSQGHWNCLDIKD